MKIFVVCHKDIIYPHMQGYEPIGVGGLAANNKVQIRYRDNQGLNISEKNPYYSELTALYWIWKNCNEDIVGLVHYRRYFSVNSLYKKVLNEKQIRKLLDHADMIIPKARVMDVTGQEPDLTIWDQFKKWHNINDLILTKDIIKQRCPDFLDSFEKVCQKKTIWPYNMLICKKEFFDSYCAWLFPILEELENLVDISEYDQYQRRLYGFISERLFNVWLEKQQCRYIEKPILNVAEKKNRIFSEISKIG